MYQCEREIERRTPYHMRYAIVPELIEAGYVYIAQLPPCQVRKGKIR
jgi:DNA gyrase/topoisomerase IV subunit B